MNRFTGELGVLAFLRHIAMSALRLAGRVVRNIAVFAWNMVVRFFRAWKRWLSPFIALLILGGLVVTIGAVVSGRTPLDLELPWESAPAAPEPTPQPARIDPDGGKVELRGKLVFPNRRDLTFVTPGEIGEILVSQGDRVEKGQELARLESLSIQLMQQEITQAEYDLDTAEKALDIASKTFATEPLRLAEIKAATVQIEKEISDIDERLEDLYEDLEDDLEDLENDLVDARQRKINAEVALARAEDNLRTFDQFFDSDQFLQIDEQQQKIVEARLAVVVAERALELAQQKLSNFEIDFDERVGNALTRVDAAERALDAARQNLADFLWDPIPDPDTDSNIDIDLLNRLQNAVAVAKTDLRQAQEAHSDLQANRELEEETLKTQVASAQAGLDRAKDVIVKIEDVILKIEESDEKALGIRERQVAIDSARLNLDKINDEIGEIGEQIAELEEGPDAKEIALLQENKALAFERMADLHSPPDQAEVILWEKTIITIRARLKDAREELAGAYLRAPVNGIVTLVNVDAGDWVSDDSLVIELLQPDPVEVHGLVEAGDTAAATPGNAALINLESMPDLTLNGVVSTLSMEARTERGVVSYPFVVAVDVPPGVEIPLGVTGVTVTLQQ